MRLSESFMPTFKEAPKDATIESHILMMRASLISKHASGVYTYLPLGARVMNKLKAILSQTIIECTKAQELVMPYLLLADLWKETGRYEKMGEGVFKLKDRHDIEYLLGPTHEETIVQVLKGNVKSYKQLPLNLFQIERKYRDEVRPRYGVMRGREFTMLDGYSFHADSESLAKTYKDYRNAYIEFFKKIGLEVDIVTADSGDMGGAISEEFMVKSRIGDDTILKCDSCEAIANQEKSKAISVEVKDLPHTGGVQEVLTPNIKTMEALKDFFDLPLEHMAKAVVFKTSNGKLILAFVRGDHDVNEAKLSSFMGEKLVVAEAEDIKEHIGDVGFLGPFNIKNPNNVTMVLDLHLKDRTNFIVGSNKKDYHLKGASVNDILLDFKMADIITAKDGDLCGVCKKGHLNAFRGIEVGHIFQLGDFYTQAMQLLVTMEDGSSKSPLMGCYGLGLDRTFATIIEQYHDEAGIIFPYAVCPYQIIILVLDKDLLKDSLTLYETLINQGYEVILDDRTINIGVKFKDADLIGIPIRLTMGKRYQSEGMVGFKLRKDKEEQFVPFVDILPYLREQVDKLI